LFSVEEEINQRTGNQQDNNASGNPVEPQADFYAEKIPEPAYNSGNGKPPGYGTQHKST
jgi:hypothetical protein